eukprot:CAMPEP_0170614192 /NCGR_PEP_ID=MMETSP0224-20130122/24668_1 /TAXON_ID=285029 /ORGANISM="Togula jolla, Strain CCCM 725" /LENGTH=266 /DNA_ID=CAMNT_0010939831 /DNA_START=90 /DNA_END=891 /DNA_ORIENTATION=+
MACVEVRALGQRSLLAAKPWAAMHPRRSAVAVVRSLEALQDLGDTTEYPAHLHPALQALLVEEVAARYCLHDLFVAIRKLLQADRALLDLGKFRIVCSDCLCVGLHSPLRGGVARVQQTSAHGHPQELRKAYHVHVGENGEREIEACIHLHGRVKIRCNVLARGVAQTLVAIDRDPIDPCAIPCKDQQGDNDVVQPNPRRYRLGVVRVPAPLAEDPLQACTPRRSSVQGGVEKGDKHHYVDPGLQRHVALHGSVLDVLCNHPDQEA